MKPLLLTMCIAFCLASPGCVVHDIHDQIALSNEQLAAINESFAKVEEANALLTKLEADLASLESIERDLTLIDAKLAGVNTELASMDEHLASLRRTINTIDSSIPFLNVSGDDAGQAATLESASPTGDEPEGDEGVAPVTPP